MYGMPVFFCFAPRQCCQMPKNLEPDILAAVQAAVDDAREDNDFWHIADTAWAQIDAQSVDYAILEKRTYCVREIFW